MKQNDFMMKKVIQKEVNLHIGMKKVQSSTADYMEALKKFLEKDELHQLRKALHKGDQAQASKKIQSLKVKCLNLGLMNLYELFVEMESLMKLKDFNTADALAQQAAESKDDILSAIA